MNFENSNKVAHQKWWLELDHYSENWYLDWQHSYYMLPSSLNEVVKKNGSIVDKSAGLLINNAAFFALQDV